MVFCANQGKKRRNPLWIASIFDADWRKSTPLQAMLPYGVSPKGGLSLFGGEERSTHKLLLSVIGGFYPLAIKVYIHIFLIDNMLHVERG